MASDSRKGEKEDSRSPRTGNRTTIVAAPVLVATDRPSLGELYARSLGEAGFRVRKGSLDPETMHLAWKRPFSLAIIECQERLNPAIEIAIAVRFRSRRAPLVLFGTGSPAPRIPEGPGHLAPIRFLTQAPEPAALVAEVCALMGIGDDDTKVLRRRSAKGEGGATETARR